MNLKHVVRSVIETLRSGGLNLVFVQRHRKRTGRVICAWEHTGWGNAIHFWPEGSENHIVGWLGRRPVVGDEIRFRMQSGRVGRYVVAEVSWMRDPPDMFSARIVGLGYLEEDNT